MKTPYTFRDLPQEDRYWAVGGSYGGRKGILEWCESFNDAITRSNLMISGSSGPYDVKVVRL